MYQVSKTPQFVRDVKSCQKKHWELDALKDAMVRLANSDTRPLAREFKVHSLSGAWKGYQGLHVQSVKNPGHDKWVLVFRVAGQRLFFVRTGDHSVYSDV